jgi:hypothetical protein
MAPKVGVSAPNASAEDTADEIATAPAAIPVADRNSRLFVVLSALSLIAFSPQILIEKGIQIVEFLRQLLTGSARRL